MSSKNVECFRTAHDAFNKRDYGTLLTCFTPSMQYSDLPRGLTVKSSDEFVNWTKEWVRAFSDVQVSDRTYHDCGDVVVCEFTGIGNNDGPLGPMPATGRRLSLPFCEIMTFDQDGKIVKGRTYYDQVSMLVQLGHMQPPA